MQCCFHVPLVPEKSEQAYGLAILLNVWVSLEEAETSKLQPRYIGLMEEMEVQVH